MNDAPTHVLLVDDDEESYLITRHLLGEIEPTRFELDWAGTYEQGIERLAQGSYDICLIDYWLNRRNGVAWLDEARKRGYDGPIIMLTGLGSHEIDIQAMEAGASDFLVKDALDPASLERAIRYAMERHRLLKQLKERASQLRLLASQLTRLEQRERQRIVRILHEHLQQMVVAIKMRISMLPGEQAGDLPGAVRQIEGLLDQVLDTSRTLAVELSPPVLHDAGLVPALEWLERWLRERYGRELELTVDESIEPSSECTRLFLFHAVREILLYLLSRHATGDVQIRFGRGGENELRIDLLDGGAADELAGREDPIDPQEHFGLFGIRERLELLGGRMEVASEPDGLTRITLYAPIEQGEPDTEAIWPAPRPEDERETARTSASPRGVISASPLSRIRVLLADDHSIVREGLAALLGAEPDLELIGEAADGQEAVEMAQRLEPDVVIMDINMPRLNGEQATRRIVQQQPDVRIIALSVHEERDMAQRMIQAGAHAFLNKGGPSDQLLEAIRGRRRTAAASHK